MKKLLLSLSCLTLAIVIGCGRDSSPVAPAIPGAALTQAASEDPGPGSPSGPGPAASAPQETGTVAASTASVSGSRVLGSVQFAPQVPPGSWNLTMSCGPAALNMLTAALHGVAVRQDVYIPRICRYLGRSDINNCLPGGTTASELVRAAANVCGSPGTYRASGWTLDRLRQEINAGHGVVVAVRAGYLPNRGYSYSGGHFVAVVGYDGTSMICHDPGTRYGAFKHYANGDFQRAMAPSNGAVVVPLL